jgi:hypothetical protein
MSDDDMVIPSKAEVGDLIVALSETLQMDDPGDPADVARLFIDTCNDRRWSPDHVVTYVVLAAISTARLNRDLAGRLASLTLLLVPDEPE